VYGIFANCTENLKGVRSFYKVYGLYQNVSVSTY